MRLREFAPSPERDDNDDVPNQLLVLANRWWNATDDQPRIEHVLNSLGWSIHQVESEDDAVQLQHRDGTTHFISADDFDPDLFEYSQLKPQRAHRDGIDLSFEKVKDDEYVDDNDDENTVAQVTATSNGKELGRVLFSIDGDTLLPQDLEVDERYRGQGIAKIMYDYVKSLGYQIRRSGQQTDAGAGFWSKHRPAQNVWESQELPTKEMIAYLKQHHDTNLHQDYLDHIKTFGKFVLKDIPVNTIKTELSGLDRAKVEQYKKMDFTKAPPIVVGDGYILDGYHRATVAKALGIPTIRAYVGVKDVNEIARIPQSELGGWGDKDTLEPMTKPPKNRKPLPGGSGYTYAVNRGDPEFMEIMIFDGDTLAAELDLAATLDPLKTWRVETVVTDPDFRGRGLGMALYGIDLSILKLTIEAGETQTKFGQAMWVMLNSIPGVEVKGYAMDRTAEYRPKPGDNVVDQNDSWTRYTFPVEPGKRSMRSTRRGTGIYSSQHVSMIAKWTGQ
jgi:GNAT superfamily N-acetyltransferase